MDKVKLVQTFRNTSASKICHAELSKIPEFNNIILSDGFTKLIDLLLAMSDCNIFIDFLDCYLPNINATVPLDSPVWPGCTILHLAILMTDNTKLWNEFFKKSDPQRKLDSLLQIQDSTEEDKINYRKRIDICLEKGCKVNIMNAQGSTPIHLAFKMHKANITNLLLSKCENDSSSPNEPSIFHIACATGNLNVVERLLNKGADVNSRTNVSFQCFYECQSCDYKDYKPKQVTIQENSTALHVATIFQHKAIVKYLLNFNADVYAQDALGLTPIHLSMVTPCAKDSSYHRVSRTIAKILLLRVSFLKEPLNGTDISHLHVAAYANDMKTIKKLLQIGSNINSVFKITRPELKYFAKYANRTPLHVAILMSSEQAIATLIQNGADIFQQTPEIRTPLQVLIRNFCDDEENSDVRDSILSRFIHDQRYNEAIDVNGVTLLHIACRLYEFDWAKELLENGADVNAKILEDEKHGGWKNVTPLFLFIAAIDDDYDGNLEEHERFVKLLIDYGANILDVKFRGMSPLLFAHYLACERPTGEYHEINYNIKQYYGHVMLSIADLLLRCQPTYDINPTNQHGFSHFHYACMRNQVDVVKKFLDSGIDVNHTADVKFGNFSDEVTIFASDFTPLHFAMHHHSKEVACLLIERGADVNAVNEVEGTPFHIATMAGFIDIQVFEMLLSKGADINALCECESTPFDSIFERCRGITHEQLKFFIKNKAITDFTREFGIGKIGLLMKNSKASDRELILNDFTDAYVKDAIKNNFNPIRSIVSIIQRNKLTLDFYLKAIQRFIDIGCQVDQQNEIGDTALHHAVLYKNVQAVDALLLLGADLNIMNNKGKSPVSVALAFKNRCMRTEKILATHLWKMKFVGLKTHKLYEEGILQFLEDNDLDEDLPRRCEDELTKLSEKIISGSLTFRCFLSERGAVVDYSTMTFIQREKVWKFFENSEELCRNFPEFCGLLTVQYKKALDRFKMHKIAMNVIPFALRVHLPELCSENVLKYFDNDELYYFVKGQRSGRKIFVQSLDGQRERRTYSRVEL